MHGAPGGRGSAARRAGVALLGLAVLAGVLLCLVAWLRSSLGAPETSTFSSIFLTLPLVCARAAGQSFAFAGYWIAAVALVIGTVWWVVAQTLNRRTPDPVFIALLAFQLFWLARFFNTLLPPAGPLSLGALSLPQQLNLGLGVLLLLALAAAWGIRPAAVGFQMSAPSRVTSFLRKRRLPSRVLGALLIVIAVLFTLYSARDTAIGASAAEAAFTMPGVFAAWLLLDVAYLAGRRLWQRLA